MAAVVIEARGVSKAFRIADRRVDSIKERVAHPFQRIEYRRLEALSDVSFDVHDGEFFGIVGRNGSGKSTLLKLLASIYRADSGTIRTAGRMAPFIELGVGFNPENSARENVILNGVLMGLGRREAQRRYDAVLDFSELRDFADVKLKNYSSGMMVRLAFAIMVQAEADIMLIDEVLAVGDAAFAKKCMDVFHERRRRGRTVVLVTHDMGTVEQLCHRALVLNHGVADFVGAPNDAAQRYFQFNAMSGVRPDFNVKVASAAVDASSAPIRVDIELEALRDFDHGRLAFQLRTHDNVTVAGFAHEVGAVPLGRHLRVRGELEHRLLPGTYHLDCWVHRHTGDEQAMQGLRLAEFDVPGETEREGVIDLGDTLRVELA